MTRKDYVLIAAALKAARDYISATYPTPLTLGVDTAAAYIASALARDNPRFDTARFLEASGAKE